MRPFSLYKRTIILFFLSLVFINISCGGPADAPKLSADTLLKKIQTKDTLYLIDVRTPGEFAQGHIPGATNIPLNVLPENIDSLLVFWDKDIVLYCRTGRRASLAVPLFIQSGFKNVSLLEGDILLWQRKGFPLEK
ncbi:MAG: rhodanese-like domain-containing protein [Fibrobacteria bacterium]|nr:rhodanese-like domain-containing protein [Fibrobacteria bacterium]